jgi:hypothetical protein
MKLASRTFPVGALAYEDIETAKRMMAKLYEQNPYLPFLPNISKDDTILKRTFSNIPGIKIKDKKIVFKVGSTSYKQGILKLDKAYNSPELKNLEPFAIESSFLEIFLKIVKKFKSKNAYINLLGPFTISQILNKTAEELDRFRKENHEELDALCIKLGAYKKEDGHWYIKRQKLIVNSDDCYANFIEIEEPFKLDEELKKMEV